MKLIIDIPENVNEHIRAAVGHNYYPFIDSAESHIVGKAVFDGIPISNEASMSDLISRQAVYDDVRDTIAMFLPFLNSYTDKIPIEVAKAIMRIPPATVAK